jgi:glycosyltransferase involved in cell wall biosynthesis
VHLICAGHGVERETLMRRLGEHVSCPGTLAPAPLARLYASADLFTFPSEIEEWANVVHEAMAAGLPVLVAAGSGMGHVVTEGVTGLVLPPGNAPAWVEAVTALAAAPQRRRAMGQTARAYAESRLPSWDDVLREDLLPRWQAAAGAMRRAATAESAVTDPGTSHAIAEPQM